MDVKVLNMSPQPGVTEPDYLRLHTEPEPFDDTVVKPAERWALVQYIQSLRRKDAEVHDILSPQDVNIAVRKVGQLPGGPMDPAWDQFDSVRVPLNPLWPEPYPVSAVAITALHDGRRIGVAEDDLRRLAAQL